MENSSQNNIHHYTMCGLDNIYLKNGFEKHETPYGPGISIQNIEGLHLAIAKAIAMRPENRMSGKEFRFLRTYLDLSQKTFGELQGAGDQAVAKWEKKGSEPIPQWATNYMRALFREYHTGKAALMDSLKEISRLEREIDELDREIEIIKVAVEEIGFNFTFDEERGEWHAKVAPQAA